MLASVWLWCFTTAIVKCDIKINFGSNDNSVIQFADQEDIIIDSNVVQIQTHVSKWNYFRFSATSWILGWRNHQWRLAGTVEKLILDNMGITFGILSLDITELEIQLGVIFPHPELQCTHLKNTIATYARVYKCFCMFKHVFSYFSNTRTCPHKSTF